MCSFQAMLSEAQAELNMPISVVGYVYNPVIVLVTFCSCINHKHLGHITLLVDRGAASRAHKRL